MIFFYSENQKLSGSLALMKILLMYFISSSEDNLQCLKQILQCEKREKS